tara:strand:- start:72 stop:350 length:279 start_codon:yes stop_codon:yes gene_type:complete
MSTDEQSRAVQQLELLQQRLKDDASGGRDVPLLEECESLISAVKAFHMEAIRFRMYNLDRYLKQEDRTVLPEVRSLFHEARSALESAGFQTK